MPIANSARVAVIAFQIVHPNPVPGGPPISAQPSAEFEALKAAAHEAWRRDGIVRRIVIHGDGETCTPPLS
jgi:hypothetical protein